MGAERLSWSVDWLSRFMLSCPRNASGVQGANGKLLCMLLEVERAESRKRGLNSVFLALLSDYWCNKGAYGAKTALFVCMAAKWAGMWGYRRTLELACGATVGRKSDKQMRNELRQRARRDLDEDLRVFKSKRGRRSKLGMAAGSAAGAENACGRGCAAHEGGAV